jgi:HK97 family phage major capsid protein
MQSNKEKRSQLIATANSLLAQPNYSKESKAKFDSLMRLADALGDSPEFSSESRTVTESYTHHFREMFMGKDKTYRTYTGLDISGNGSALVAAEFEARLVAAQNSVGPLFAGSPALTNIVLDTNAPLKMGTVDDTSATGYVQADQTAVTEAELASVGSVSFGTTTFSSGIVLASNELIQDISSWTPYQGLIESSLGKRISRIQNVTFLASLITALAANSSASVAAAGGTVSYRDIPSLVGSVNASYRHSEKAAFLMNSSTQMALASISDSQGHPIFPNVLASRPTLLEYPIYISDFADSIGSGKNPILFGDWSYVFTRSMPGYDLQILKEQFVLSGYTGAILRKRSDLKYSIASTSDSAIKMLHFA